MHQRWWADYRSPELQLPKSDLFKCGDDHNICCSMQNGLPTPSYIFRQWLATGQCLGNKDYKLGKAAGIKALRSLSSSFGTSIKNVDNMSALSCW